MGLKCLYKEISELYRDEAFDRRVLEGLIPEHLSVEDCCSCSDTDTSYCSNHHPEDSDEVYLALTRLTAGLETKLPIINPRHSRVHSERYYHDQPNTNEPGRSLNLRRAEKVDVEEFSGNVRLDRSLVRRYQHAVEQEQEQEQESD